MGTISSGIANGPEIPARPPITILQSEADALADLALSPFGKLRLAARLLLQELDRARTAKEGKLPNDVVSMGSYVLFLDEGSQTRHSVQLVYPSQADIAFGRVSVLALIGAGLIGLRRGQVIDWPDRKGRYRRLRILDVVQSPRDIMQSYASTESRTAAAAETS